MTDDLTSKLQDVFRSVFNAPGLNISTETTASDVKGWDSLKHIELIVSVENTFGVKFRTAEVASMEDVGDLLSRLRRKLGDGG